MGLCEYNPYTLPTIEFVGGETQLLLFNTYIYTKDKPYGLEGATADFSIVNFLNKNGQAVLSKKMEARYSADISTLNVLAVTLTPEETYQLRGKYIYQITIRDIDGNVDIPRQGIMLVTGNINKGFIATNG